jgi:peptidoglycan pentaglycine glycine transferase (the first glycine)
MLERQMHTDHQSLPNLNQWDRFVQNHPSAHPLQLHGWGELKSRFGWCSESVTVADAAGMPIAGAQLLYRRFGPLTLAYAPRGPLTDWSDRGLTTHLLEIVRCAAARHGAAVLKIEPELLDTPANRALLTSNGFRPSAHTIQPPSTILLDISGEEASILQRMKSKWRYNIRLAERKGVTVRTAARGDLPIIHQLLQTTAVRDSFAVHSASYYAAAFDLLTPTNATFLLADYDGEPLAVLVVAVCGRNAVYLWGASSDRERNRMPNHALQWGAIRWARSQGATQYDLWGIPDELGKLALGLRNGDGSGVEPDDLPIDLERLPAHGLWGVYRFKQGFGGQVVRMVGAWDLPINELGYRAYRVGIQLHRCLSRMERLGEPGKLAPTRRFRTAHLQSPNLPFSPSLQLHSITTPQAWQATLAQLPDPHVLQSWEWGELKGQTGWRAERIALCAEGRPLAGFQLLWRELAPGLPLRIAYAPKGPLLDWQDYDLMETTLSAIEQVARARGCIFVKIDPDVREDTTPGRRLLHILGRRGWRFSGDQIQFKNTATTDLTIGEMALLAAMKQKWRYNIRLAERRGVHVRQGDERDLAAFYTLYAETGQRDGFLVRPYAYYRTTWASYLAAQRDPANPAGGALLLAEHPAETQPVAGLFLLRYGQRAWYFYGASSDRQRRDMPNYLLQWAALRWAMTQGCTVYDWWGAPTQLEDDADPLQRVWQFKQGFGAHFQPQIGAWDFPVSPMLYQLYGEVMPQVIAWMKRRAM